MSNTSPAQQARALVGSGRTAEALQFLEGLAAAGDGEASFVLALWILEGRLLARDTPRARQLFGRAAEAGYRDGARVFSALLATGVGGPPDWAGSVAVLEEWAERDDMAARQLELLGAMALSPEGDPLQVPEPEVLSEVPYVARLPGLFSPGECRFLVELAEPRLKPALVFHEGQQRFVQDPVRRSDAAGFPFHLEWPAIRALNRRIAAASGTKADQGETLQVLRYGPGQEYRTHLDAVPGLSNQRHLTVIVYLNDDYADGETRFTESGLSVRGRLGDGLLFRNTLPDGRPDPASKHEGRPVTAGVKLIASRWIRQRPPERPEEGFGPQEVAKPAPSTVPAR